MKAITFNFGHIVLMASAVIIISIGCKKRPVEDTVTTVTPPVVTLDTTPVITSISPTFARSGETITVYGKHLLADSAGMSVTINSRKATISRYTNDSLKVKVPDNSGSGKVVINTAKKSYVGPDFSYSYQVTVTTIAGTGAVGKSDGLATNGSFNCPWGIVADNNGDLYIADTYNRLIRKIDGATRQLSTIPIPVMIGSSNFYSPYNITIDNRSKTLYVTDFNAHLMKVDASGEMSVILNDLQPLAGIALGQDNKLYVGNNTTGNIFKLDTTGENKTTFAQGLTTPRNIIFDKDNTMFIAGYGVYKMGTDGSYTMAVSSGNFKGWEIAVDSLGNFYEADHFNNRIRKIDKNGDITVIAGSGDPVDKDGIGLEASFNGPQGITIDKEGNLYVTTFNYTDNTGNKVRKVSFH